MTFKDTARTCYLCYIWQAAVNNLPPLLFLTFEQEFGINVSQLGFLVMLNFGTQLLSNMFTGRLVSRAGYRLAIVLSSGLCALGLFLMGALPRIFGFPALVVAMIINGVGGGVGDVLCSAIIQTLPTDTHGGNAMALLHSAYSWGMMIVILVSTLLFRFLGMENWHWVAFLWALFPLLGMFLFLRVPMVATENGGHQAGMSAKSLFSLPLFWILGGMMFCGAGSEISMSQWASLFAEQSLGVDKMVGDILGPCLFGFSMAVVRTVYGLYGQRFPLRNWLFVSSILAVVLYALTVFSDIPMLALFGCAFTGAATALFWPGTLSISASMLPHGGAAMFGYLAFIGNLGSTFGPQMVSLTASVSHDLKTGLLAAGVFPLGMVALTSFCRRSERRG